MITTPTRVAAMLQSIHLTYDISCEMMKLLRHHAPSTPRHRHRGIHMLRPIEWLLSILMLLVWCSTMLSPFISPTVTQIPAFLNLAFPMILGFYLLIVVYCWIRRMWRWLTLYLLVLICSLGYVHSYYPIGTRTGLVEPHDLRLLTYNVAGLEYTDQRDSLVSEIQDIGADIVCLQEGTIPESARANKSFFRQHFGDQYPHIDIHHDLSLTLLSRYPILHKEQIKYPSQTNGSMMYLLQLPEQHTALIINNHMESYSLGREEKRKIKGYITQFSLQQIPQQLLEIKRRLGPMLNTRAFAAEQIREAITRYQETYSPTYTIVTGDLNDTPMSYTYHQLRHHRHDAFVQTGLGAGISFNEHMLPFRIDHLFYEGDLKAIGCLIPSHPSLSDHNPLIVDFEIK